MKRRGRNERNNQRRRRKLIKGGAERDGNVEGKLRGKEEEGKRDGGVGK